MKKIILAGALALTLLAVQQDPAPAWLNFKFGAGINWNWQSGGNNTLWGLFRNGQPPTPGAQSYDPAMCNSGLNPFNIGAQCMQPGMMQGGMMQPGCYMQQPGMMPMQPGMPGMGGPEMVPPGMVPPMVPGQSQQQCPQRPPMYFPGMNPYNNQEFQYFGRQQPGSPDPYQANLASQGYYPQYHQSAYYYPYSAPSYQAPSPYNYGFSFSYGR